MKKAKEDVIEADSLIQPLIRVAGEKHLLEKLMEADAMPEMKAVGYMNLDPSRRHHFISYVVTFKGHRVLKIEVSEPNMKLLVEEESKINFVQSLMDQGEL